MIFEGLRFAKADADHLGPMVEALDHRDRRYCSQKQHQPPGPTTAGTIAFVLLHRLQRAQILGCGRSVHGNTSSSAPSGAKWRSTSASLTSGSVAGRHRGLLSLSTITARTPS